MQDLIRRGKIAAVFVAIYAALILLLVGWRSDHTFFVLFISTVILAHNKSFNWIIFLSAFIVFWITYDLMRIYPNYLLNPVHVIEPYEIELRLFGVWDNGIKVIPSEWFTERTTPFLSVFSGISYLLWVPGPIIYTLYLGHTDPKKMINFSYAFLLTNFIGFIIYYLYPAAPPWYYINYGDATDFTIPGSEALLAEFDSIMGIPIFNGMYAKNANVFAAIPSLHAAYPVIGLLFAIRHKIKSFIGFFSLLTFGIWFAAVYSQHHYIIDLILGLFCAVGAYYLMVWLVTTRAYQMFQRTIIRQIR